MRAETVTTTDRTLLPAVRAVLEEELDALLCVAFVQERGLHLVSREVSRRRAAGARTRLLLTTVFMQDPSPALNLAVEMGFDVRVLNPGRGRTFHPKVYLGRDSRRIRAIVGSANLTGGLAANVEVAVALQGSTDDAPLAAAWAWAESVWADPRAEPWMLEPGVVPRESETLEPELLDGLLMATPPGTIVPTLARSAPNRVVGITPLGVHVETSRSSAVHEGGNDIPAWMFNIAWEYLRTHGTLSNRVLLNDLRVHRSSAVCALLARLPDVVVRSSTPISLEWTGAPAPPLAKSVSGAPRTRRPR